MGALGVLGTGATAFYFLKQICPSFGAENLAGFYKDVYHLFNAVGHYGYDQGAGTSINRSSNPP